MWIILLSMLGWGLVVLGPGRSGTNPRPEPIPQTLEGIQAKVNLAG